MQPTQLIPGLILDQRFQIENAVTSGGMGTVLRAQDLLRAETVAIKVLLGRDRAALQRFERERLLLQELRHPGIVRYVAHGILPDGAPYLAMEWLEGEDLAHRLTRQALSLAETVAIGIAVASALAAAHESGIIHRDIKPANLFLQGSQPQRLKILDFGIARLFGADGATRTGTVVGTPDYMAPEQVRGDREIDARADLFSLGCVLYECLKGQPPFASDQIMGVFGKILFEPTPDLLAEQPELPPALSRLIVALLEKDREQRPARAADVLATLLALTQRDLERPSAPVIACASRPHGLTTHEQRLMSIVVVSAHSTVTPDAPTAIAAPTQTWLRMVSDLGQPFSARSEQLPDGSVLALLTGQPTASDQARQAARLALRIRDSVTRRSSDPAAKAAPAAIQIVVCTGRGNLERGLLDAGAIERAASLLTRALEQQKKWGRDDEGKQIDVPITLDEMTRGLLDARFITYGLAGLTLLVSEQPLAEPVRLVLGRSTPFFGRDRELSLLQAVMADCFDEPRARVALITAEAGMGKSRLCQEFLQRAAQEHSDLSVWIGRGDPLGAGSPFGLLANSLRHALGLPEGAAAEEQREELRTAIFQRLSKGKDAKFPNVEQKLRVHEFVAELLSLRKEESTPASVALKAAQLDPMLMGDQIRRAALDLLETECKNRPLLWVLEDLHWGDLPTVRLIDVALRELCERPLFVLALARPSVHDTFPRLWEGRGVQEIRLTGLSRKASEKIARAVLGNTQHLDAVLGSLDRASGNAFFLEEMLRAAATGQLTEAPATVLAMVQSRIERLLPQARRVLRAACIFGSVFWGGGVARLLGDRERATGTPKGVTEWLDLLTEQELIARRPESRLYHEVEYTFVHALVRDAAYAMLTEADRVLGHRLAAQFLEEAGECDAVVLAEHWERSGELQHAIACYRRAAWQALEGNDLDAVLHNGERAIACGASGQERGEVEAALSEAQQWRGNYHGTIQHGRVALALLPPHTPRWLQVIGAMAIAAGRLTDGALLQELSRQLLEKRDESARSEAFLTAAIRTALQLYILGDYVHASALLDAFESVRHGDTPSDSPAAEAMLCLLRANRAAFDWKLDLAVAHFEQAAALFEQIGDLRNAGSQKLDAAFFLTDLGQFTRSMQLSHEVIETAGRLGIARLSTVAYGALASALCSLGRLEEAGEGIGRMMEQAKQSGDRRILGAGHILYARLYLAKGELVRAEAAAEEAIKDLSEMPRFRARGLAILARISIARGRLDEARRSAAQGYAIFQELGRLGTDEALIELAYAEALLHLGDEKMAQEILQTGRERLLAQAACISDLNAKKGFLSLPDHVLLLRVTDDKTGLTDLTKVSR